MRLFFTSAQAYPNNRSSAPEAGCCIGRGRNLPFSAAALQPICVRFHDAKKNDSFRYWDPDGRNNPRPYQKITASQ